MQEMSTNQVREERDTAVGALRAKALDAKVVADEYDRMAVEVSAVGAIHRLARQARGEAEAWLRTEAAGYHAIHRDLKERANGLEEGAST